MKTSSLLKSIVCLSGVAMLSTALPAENKISTTDTNTTGRIQTEKRAPAAVVVEENEKLNKDADNTQRNVRDRNNRTLTPGDQGNSKEDIELTRQIRRAFVKDKSLSTTAQNVKIITRDGKVTLRGPVKTTAEKEAIVRKAKDVATSAHLVTDELEVKTKTDVNSPSPKTN